MPTVTAPDERAPPRTHAEDPAFIEAAVRRLIEMVEAK
jgi:hypothetical protein